MAETHSSCSCCPAWCLTQPVFLVIGHHLFFCVCFLLSTQKREKDWQVTLKIWCHLWSFMVTFYKMARVQGWLSESNVGSKTAVHLVGLCNIHTWKLNVQLAELKWTYRLTFSGFCHMHANKTRTLPRAHTHTHTPFESIRVSAINPYLDRWASWCE